MDCLFCSIIKGEIPAKVIAENELAIAFLDVCPISDGHTIVIPKKHFRDLSSCDQEYLEAVIDLSKDVAQMLLNSKLKPWGINYLSNEGAVAGQEIKHFHLHVIPKYGKNEGFKVGIGERYVEDLDKVYKILEKEIIKKGK